MSAVDNAEGTFALRGGGHNPTAGSANINQGVTIDLRSLDGVEVSLDKTITSVGGGAVWGNVYSKLDSMGLMVAGGRVSNVGVGGLTLGGVKSTSRFERSQRLIVLNRWSFILFSEKGFCQ